MVYTYKKNTELGKVCIVLNDLIRINNERIECYGQARKNVAALNAGVTHLLDDIIAEGYVFNEGLYAKINELDSHPKIGGYASGFIHQAWRDLRVAFTAKTQNALLSSCEYNEEVTQLAYKTALNVSTEIDRSCSVLIEEQWHSLKRIVSLLKQCHEVRSYSRSVQTYFN